MNLFIHWYLNPPAHVVSTNCISVQYQQLDSGCLINMTARSKDDFLLPFRVEGAPLHARLPLSLRSSAHTRQTRDPAVSMFQHAEARAAAAAAAAAAAGLTMADSLLQRPL
jgi:hypothetical protein